MVRSLAHPDNADIGVVARGDAGALGATTTWYTRPL